MTKMPAHFWRIHKRVAQRVLLDLPERLRHVIASDEAHEGQEYQWFEKKVWADAMRLFTDASYYDNDPWTFRTSKHA
jgi:hypothetical protein